MMKCNDQFSAARPGNPLRLFPMVGLCRMPDGIFYSSIGGSWDYFFCLPLNFPDNLDEGLDEKFLD